MNYSPDTNLLYYGRVNTKLSSAHYLLKAVTICWYFFDLIQEKGITCCLYFVSLGGKEILKSTLKFNPCVVNFLFPFH